MSDSMTLCKLIILYMLEQVDFPLTTSQITEFILGKEYSDYFTTQQGLNELSESHLICSENRKGMTYYQNTREGSNTIAFFGKRIPQVIIDRVKEYLNSNHYSLKNAASVMANYYPTESHEYAVRCQVRESGSVLIDLTLTVPDEQTASSIRDNWHKKNASIYKYLMEELL